MTICVRSPTQYGDRNGGPTSRNIASAATTASPPRAPSRYALPYSPVGLSARTSDHRCEQREVGELRHERFAEVVDHADDDRSDERALEAAHAADDDDHERQRQQIEIHSCISAENWPAHHAAEGGERCAGREHSSRKPRHVDPVAAAISGSSTVARTRAPISVLSLSDPQANTNECRNGNHKQAIPGKTTPAPAPSEPTSTAGSQRERVASPDHQRGVSKEQREPHRHHHLSQRLRRKAAKEESLHEEADGQRRRATASSAPGNRLCVRVATV